MSVEFLPDSDTPAAGVGPRPMPPGGRRVLVGLALVGLVAVGAIVVGTGHGGSIAKPTPAPSLQAQPLPPPPVVPVHFIRPDSIAFGAPSVDVLAAGGRMYSLTPTLIAMAGRYGTDPVVRGAPFGLSERDDRARLFLDAQHSLLWAVALGGTAIGAYDSETLDPLSETASRYPIEGAVAMDESLWFTTDHGLYTAVAGPGRPKPVPHMRLPLGPIVADRTLHQVIAADRRQPVRLHALTAYGQLASQRVPLATVTSMAFPSGALWLSGTTPTGPRLIVLDPPSMRVRRVIPVPGQLGRTASLVGSFGNRLLMRAAPDDTALYCVDGYTGTFKQVWRLPLGTVSLDGHGLLVDAGRGITAHGAGTCLAP
jgi:hypothetical protein